MIFSSLFCHFGVTVGGPVTRLPPAQIPACGIPAPGSSRILAFAPPIHRVRLIPLSEVGLRDPAQPIRRKFPLRAMYPRQPLPHVIGATVSEYYGLIRLPNDPPSSSVWLGRRTCQQRSEVIRLRLSSVSGFPLTWLNNRRSYTPSGVPGVDGVSQVPDASLHTCHPLMTPADPPESRRSRFLCIGFRYVNSVAICSLLLRM